MKFHCPSCNAKYRISEEKFESHPNSRLRCKQCSSVFSVKDAVETALRMGIAESIPPPAERKAGPEGSVVPRESSVGGSLGGNVNLGAPLAAAPKAPPPPRAPTPVSPLAASALPRTAPGPASGLKTPPRPMGGAPVGAPPPPSQRAALVADAAVNNTQAPARKTLQRGALPGTGRAPLDKPPAPRPIALARSSAVPSAEPASSVLPLLPELREAPVSYAPPALQLAEPVADGLVAEAAEAAVVVVPVALAVSEVLPVPDAGAASAPVAAPVLAIADLLSSTLQEPGASHVVGSDNDEAIGKLQVTAEAAAEVEAKPSLEVLPQQNAAPAVETVVGHPTFRPPPGLSDLLTGDAERQSAAPLQGWYLEYEGTPVGPLQEGDLHARALQGTLRGDTLVWRGAYTDWKEASEYPELAALIASTQVSGALAAPSQDSALQGASLQVSGAGFVDLKQAHGRDLFGNASLEVPLGAVPSPSKTGFESVSSGSISFPPVAAAPRAPVTALVASVVVALGLGTAGGYTWGQHDAQQRFTEAQPTRAVAPAAQAVNAEVPKATPNAQPAVVPAAVNPASDPVAVEAANEVAAAKGESQGKASSSGKGSSKSGREATEKPASNAGTLLAGLDTTQLAGGPQAAGGSGGSKASSSQGLDASIIQSTVQRYQPSVNRGCWQKTLASSGGATTSARITITIRVAPNGSVSSASHSGESLDYPGLASCIVTRVKGWTFPSAAGPTTVEVPFVFAAQ